MAVALAVDMSCRRVCVDGKKVVGVDVSVILLYLFWYEGLFGLLRKEKKIVCCANLGPIFSPKIEAQCCLQLAILLLTFRKRFCGMGF